MKKTGSLLKMQTQLQEEVQYHLPIGEDSVYLNELIGQTIKLTYENAIYCIKCGRKTVKSFNQGFCYPCFRDAPEAADWIIHPEKSQAHLGIEDRDLAYEQAAQLQPHIVYLSLTSGIKVGVTRHTQVPTRWIDQGASQAIKLAETPNRYLAGMIEVSLKQHMDDKTNWQQMLKNLQPSIDLIAERDKVAMLVDEAYHEYLLPKSEIVRMNFPVLHYPVKVKSIGFEKVPEYEGKMVGIKGQYLMFENGIVLNIRKYAGFVVSVEV
ncbi:MAG: hypothetical protein CMD31_03675 [Flavobacteriales bacterium]|nr:hypothetical protein [Flavobacteriales bacterium]|tara:strand:- start:177605 stop:178402 length:798 start_codon:yes stop_codon:yes gene_type:complete